MIFFNFFPKLRVHEKINTNEGQNFRARDRPLMGFHTLSCLGGGQQPVNRGYTSANPWV